MNKNQFIFSILVGFIIIPQLLPAQTRIKVSKHYAPQMQLAVPPFANRGTHQPRLSSELANLLIDDLFLSGFFIPLIDQSFIREADQSDRKRGKIKIREWASLGTEILVKGSYLVAEDKITIDCRAIDISDGRQVYGKKYTTLLNQQRRIIHTIADEIVQTVTGKRGLARTRIAFVSAFRGQKKVYVMEASGHNWRRINSGPGYALHPDWSPDGNILVYTSYNSTFPWVIWDDLSTGQRKVISSQPGLNAFPAISPDGEWIALTLSRDGNNEIYKMKTSGEELTRLTSSRANDCSPSWSPNGRKIAFTSDRGGTPQIYIMDADGKNLKRLTRRGRYNTSPAWSPRGNLIAYTSRIQNNFKICAIDLKTGEVTRLTKGRQNDEDPSWAPDGRHLVYTSRQRGKTNLYVLDILNPEPIQITTGTDCFSPAWSP